MSQTIPLYRFHSCSQQQLFPLLEENLPALTKPMRLLAIVISAVNSDILPDICRNGSRRPGRPRKSRHAIFNAFIAKAVFNIPTTKDLLERLRFDKTLRRLVRIRRTAQRSNILARFRGVCRERRSGTPSQRSAQTFYWR